MKSWLFFFIFLFWETWSYSQSPSFLHYISRDSAVDLYLKLDWKLLERKKFDKTYRDAVVQFFGTHQDTISLQAKVRTRGHMRLDICSFPPLKLKIEKDDLARHKLSNLNEMDVVEHCHNSDADDQLLLKEFMAYKLWELVSPNYFKTQLIRLHYVNPDGSEAHEPGYSFVKEDVSEMASRLNGRIIKTKVISRDAVEHTPFLLTCLFEFMIGNTDWYIPTRHNLEFLGIPGCTLLTAIPYDFDYSGLVNAPYAVHDPSLNLGESTTRSRYYQGWCESEDAVANQLQIFLKQKDNILAMPSHIRGLDAKNIKSCTDYLTSFFEIIENPKKLNNQIIRHCDMWPVK
ncbi:MAG TPA: hypothetical protein VJ508_20100 [Saprospiraceae bacterium]|nr:hypothetical protein [Saprospiraceae bacterium]